MAHVCVGAGTLQIHVPTGPCGALQGPVGQTLWDDQHLPAFEPAGHSADRAYAGAVLQCVSILSLSHQER